MRVLLTIAMLSCACLNAGKFYISTDVPNEWVEIDDEDIGLGDDYSNNPPGWNEAVDEMLGN